jgi:hypothetical protein
VHEGGGYGVLKCISTVIENGKLAITTEFERSDKKREREVAHETSCCILCSAGADDYRFVEHARSGEKRLRERRP